MAIKDRILNFIKTNENFTPSQIAEALNLNKNTVRGRLSELRKEFVISKRKITYEKKRTKKEVKILKEEKREIEEVIEEEPEEEEIWIRKIVKITGYAKPFEGAAGKEFVISYALTYENNDIDRSKELKKELIKQFGKIYTDGEEASYGYDAEYITEPEINYIYPNIQTGNEAHYD